MTTDGPYDTTDATDEANFAIRPVSRRLLIGGGAALGVGLTAVGSPHQAAAAPGRLSASWNGRSTRAAIRFLKGVTNAYRTSGPRLAQSYQDASGLRDTAFVYDNALAIIALLEAGEGAAARALGDGLLYAQTPRRDVHRRSAAAGLPRRHLHRTTTGQRTSAGVRSGRRPRWVTCPGRASPWRGWPELPASPATGPARSRSPTGSSTTRTPTPDWAATRSGRRRAWRTTSPPSTTSTWRPSSGWSTP